jgi:tetratricopeptide (TPR) repeat protein
MIAKPNTMRGISQKAFFLFIGLLLFATAAPAQSPGSSSGTNLEAYYQQAMDLISAYQFERAQELLSFCYHEDPENIDYLAHIAYCNFQLGRYGDAKIFYNKILSIDSTNAIALSSLGNIYEREYNYGEAASYFLQLLQVDSTNSYYYKRNGGLALKQNNPIGALYFYLKAHQLNEADIEVIDQLSAIYLGLGQLDYAERMLDKGFKLDPKNIKLLYNKANLHNRRKEYHEVIEAVEGAMVQGDTSDYYQMMVGVAYVRVDSADKAIEHLQAIVAREKDTEHTHHYLGLAYFYKRELEKAEEHLRKALELGISGKMGIYHGDLANTLVASNDYPGAIEHYQAAYRYNPTPRYLFRLAQLSDSYYKDKKIALKYFDRYLATADEEFRAYSEQRAKQIREYLHFAKGKGSKK